MKHKVKWDYLGEDMAAFDVTFTVYGEPASKANSRKMVKSDKKRQTSLDQVPESTGLCKFL